MTINNERLFHFANPEKCWHDAENDEQCSKCGKSFRGYYLRSVNPSYSTSPDDRERLWGYLMRKEEMWEEFFWWCWNSSPKDAQKLRDKFVSWLFSPIDGVPRWVSLLSDWLGMEVVRLRFGVKECPYYPEECDGRYNGNSVYEWCESCNGSGRIRAEWAKEE